MSTYGRNRRICHDEQFPARVADVLSSNTSKKVGHLWRDEIERLAITYTLSLIGQLIRFLMKSLEYLSLFDCDHTLTLTARSAGS